METLQESAVGARDRRAALSARLERVRSATLELCAPLSPEDAVVQSMPDASPAKWHLAHTTWFFETFVLAGLRPGRAPFHPGYSYLFNSYYENVGARHARPQRGLITRPSLAEVREYRGAIERELGDWLAAAPRPGDGALLDVLELGLAHEEQHQELLVTDVKHLLSCNPLEPAYRTAPARPPSARVSPLEWTRHGAGLRALGHAGPGFAFDNEGPAHDVHVPAFELASRPVTCGEYLEFVEGGGYADPRWWLSDGWQWVCETGVDAPAYWRRERQGWSLFTLAGRRALDPAEPLAHVSYYEADAFARFCGARLPREAEWETAAREHAPAGHFADSRALHPRPVRGAGLYGDVWVWTQSPYVAYPGYRPAEGALGEYNGKFMANQMVLRGGSCATPPGHVRATYRNFFPPTARWQFSGLRLARDA